MKVKVFVMEKMKIVGMRGVDFTDDSGRQVVGTSYFYVQDDVDGVIGQLAGKLFISDRKRDAMDYLPAAGDVVWVFYDRYGKPSKFERVGGK